MHGLGVVVCCGSSAIRFGITLLAPAVAAFADEGADTDKDERVSLLEAFDYARLEVARVYESDNRLLTEHALLDDNGDGAGSTAPSPDSADGAAALFL